MILFKTRYEIKKLHKEISILKSMLVDYGKENRGYAQIINELTKFMYDQLAEVRKDNGLTFSEKPPFKVVPEYGPVKRSDIKVGKNFNTDKDNE